MDRCHFYARFILLGRDFCTQTACSPIPQALHVFFHPEIGEVSQGLIMRHAGIRSPEGEKKERRVNRSMVRVYELPRSWPPLYVNNTWAAFPHPDPGVHVLKVRQSTAVQPL
jgi:hypothetical protein